MTSRVGSRPNRPTFDEVEIFANSSFAFPLYLLLPERLFMSVLTMSLKSAWQSYLATPRIRFICPIAPSFPPLEKSGTNYEYHSKGQWGPFCFH
jgi:hypothetical protein